MIRAYSQRLLPPYSGVVQIAETERARAQSFDGINWEFHYLPDIGHSNGGYRRDMGYALDRSFYRIANFQTQILKPYIPPSFLDPDEITECIDELAGFLSSTTVPFPNADIYEYWLLDGDDESPLALIYACCEESQRTKFPSRCEWTSLPHSKMKIENTEGEDARNEAPVNNRLQYLVARRAGNKPRGAWFERSYEPDEGFPGLLIREDWPHEADSHLCQRYLQRKSPRLLMLQGLSADERERMEIAAKKHAEEVDDYYSLFPSVVDQRLISRIRVEARLRRNGPQHASPVSKESKPAVRPMSKDMRIFEI